LFVSFEGIEASGKSTLLAAVEVALRAQGRNTLRTREPGGTPAGDAMRRVFLDPMFVLEPISEVLLVNASRAELVQRVITPALSAGVIVLCDRYVHSTLAYQGYGRGLPLSTVRMLCEAATGGLMPNITLLVDVSFQTSRRRIAARAHVEDRLELESSDFHDRVRRGFLQMSTLDSRIVVIDGEQSVDRVFEAAMQALGARLP
jgi:dTMP kinase